MKIHKTSENQLDERLRLDKRRDPQAFCRGFDSAENLPGGFYDRQDKIRDGLEKEFFTSFDDDIDRSRIKPWKLATSHPFFYFPAEPINSERIIIELSDEILDDKLIAVLWAYLENTRRVSANR